MTRTANGREILTDALKLQDIAARLECRLEGDGEIEIRGVAGIERRAAGDLTFFTNPKYAAQRCARRAPRRSSSAKRPTRRRARCCGRRHPYLAFARAVELFADGWRPPPGIHSTARRRPATYGSAATCRSAPSP